MEEEKQVLEEQIHVLQQKLHSFSDTSTVSNTTITTVASPTSTVSPSSSKNCTATFKNRNLQPQQPRSQTSYHTFSPNILVKQKNDQFRSPRPMVVQPSTKKVQLQPQYQPISHQPPLLPSTLDTQFPQRPIETQSITSTYSAIYSISTTHSAKCTTHLYPSSTTSLIEDQTEISQPSQQRRKYFSTTASKDQAITLLSSILPQSNNCGTEEGLPELSSGPIYPDGHLISPSSPPTPVPVEITIPNKSQLSPSSRPPSVTPPGLPPTQSPSK